MGKKKKDVFCSIGMFGIISVLGLMPFIIYLIVERENIENILIAIGFVIVCIIIGLIIVFAYEDNIDKFERKNNGKRAQQNRKAADNPGLDLRA